MHFLYLYKMVRKYLFQWNATTTFHDTIDVSSVCAKMGHPRYVLQKQDRGSHIFISLDNTILYIYIYISYNFGGSPDDVYAYYIYICRAWKLKLETLYNTCQSLLPGLWKRLKICWWSSMKLLGRLSYIYIYIYIYIFIGCPGLVSVLR